jgi:DNA-binding NarL/FixJ family response regulator
MRQGVTVIVAESLPAFREALMRALTPDLGAEVIYSGEDLEEALDWIITTRPTLAVIDRDSPGPGAFAIVAVARQRSPRTRVVLTAARISDAEIVQACRAGVHACVSKSDSIDRLHATLRAVLAGRVVFPRASARSDAVRNDGNDRKDRPASPTRPLEELTKRETQVLAHVARGLSTKEIAAVLDVSAKTVDRHKANVMAKLDIHDRVLLALYAIRAGLVSPWSGQSNG